MTLFDLPPVETPVALSADQRRTIRRAEMLAAGRHPTTLRPTLDPEWGLTCGDCDHHVTHSRARTFHKCEVAPGGVTHGPGSDVRVSWPASTALVVS